MSLTPWSLNNSLGSGVRLVETDDLARFRAAAKGRKVGTVSYSDATLLDLINFEISMTIGLASCVDHYDKKILDQQEAFKAAYADFVATIENLSEPLRSSVALPSVYVDQINDSILLHYARERPSGRPKEWKRDDFHMTLLLIYQLVTGLRPAGGVNGPTVKFMRSFVSHLQQCLNYAADADNELKSSVSELWSLRPSETFLKDWFQNNGGAGQVYATIDKRVSRLQYANFWPKLRVVGGVEA
ncbi:hypothetical protein KZ810_07125 [Sphingomonas sp. RHCKR47]|uniref:hypothetical protein n=1 Tax=Sphingomonas citricola TaxID=2862498 RepID=UPI001CA47E80|nr:hypothetical protein [Sphingomonas citricola]MBW6523269.1 hypothetical protein [Sphingomonas citricola]